jgi:hypothetical protein
MPLRQLTCRRKFRMAHRMRTFLKGWHGCVKSHDNNQLGNRAGEVPLAAAGEKPAADSGKKGSPGDDKRQQGCREGLFHHTSGIIDRPACHGNRPAQMRRHLCRGQYLFTYRPKGQGRQEKTGVVQRFFQTSLQRICPLEAGHRRACWPRRPADFIQQYRRPYDDKGNRKGLQENGSKGRFTFAFFDSLPEAYLRLPFIQGQQLQPAAGSETTWSFEFQNNRNLCRCDEPRFEQVIGKAFYVRRRQIEGIKNHQFLERKENV